MLAKSGDERLIPAMIAAAIRNNTSERVEFSLKQAMPMFDGEKLLVAEFERQFPRDQLHRLRESGTQQTPHHAIASTTQPRWIGSMKSTRTPNGRKRAVCEDIRAMRNYHVHFMVPELLDYMRRSDDPGDSASHAGGFRLVHAIGEPRRDRPNGPRHEPRRIARPRGKRSMH